MNKEHCSYRVHIFVEGLEDTIMQNAQTRVYSEDTAMQLKRLSRDAEKLAKRMREVEWLLRGDITQDEFLQRISEI